jgi:hypothetical protein
MILPPDILQMLAVRCLGPGAEHEVAATVIASPGFGGSNGDKSVIELTAASRRCRCFVKSLPPGLSEASIYRSLARHHAAIPELYAAFTDAEGGECLVLETLAQPCLKKDDEDDFRGLVEALAAFNALPADDLPVRSAG